METLFEQIMKYIDCQSLPIGCKIESCLTFADICWDSDLDWRELIKDPAILVQTSVRQVAVQRIKNELRYFAGPSSAEINRMSSEELDNLTELGIFDSLQELLFFVASFMQGTPLSEIRLTRRKPHWMK